MKEYTVIFVANTERIKTVQNPLLATELYQLKLSSPAVMKPIRNIQLTT